MKNVTEAKAVEKDNAGSSFLVGTAGGTFIINFLAGVSLNVAENLFNNFIRPPLRRKFQAVQEQVKDYWNNSRGPFAIFQHVLRNREKNTNLQELLPTFNRGSNVEGVTLAIIVTSSVSHEIAQNLGDEIQLIAPTIIGDHHSTNVLTSSKIIRTRFNLRVVSKEQEQEAQAKELKDLAERAMTLDENATLQIGGITIIHKDEHRRLTMSTVRETDVPIISSVTKFGERELRIEGCFLNGCGFKASTSSQYTDLIVFEEVKRKDGLEVILARVPEANELLLDDHTFIYACKSVFCGAKLVIVRSEGDLIKTQQPPIIDEPQKSHIKTVVLVLFVIFLMLGIGWVTPSSSFIVILGLAMLLPGTCWYLSGQRSNTSRGALDGEPTTASCSGAKVEQEAIYRGSTYSPIVAHKDIYKRGSVRKRVLEELRSVK